MSIQDQQTALRKVIDDNDGWGWTWASQNIQFTPLSDLPFLIATALPSSPDAGEIGAGRSKVYGGIFQIDLYVPIDQGDGVIMAQADTIRAAYYAADPLNYNSTQVRIISAAVSEQSREDNLYRVRVEINYESYIRI